MDPAARELNIRLPSVSATCTCTWLAETFVDTILPDHVCLETMFANVRALMRDGLVTSSSEWPTRLHGRRVGFAVREWAQEPPNQTLANLLRDSSSWHTEVNSLRANFELWSQRNRGADLEGWINGTAWWRQGKDGKDPGGERYLANRLRQKGLPNTPATVQHLRAVAAGVEHAPLPARGLLVTTLVYVRAFRVPPHSNPILFIDENPEFLLGGSLELITGPILDGSKQIALAHRKWLRRWERHPLTDLRTIRRAQPGSLQVATPKDPEWYSYRWEAMQITTDELKLRVQMHLNGPEGAITEYLDEVYRRVRKRRSDVGMPTRPPGKWRAELRPRLHNLLRSSN